MHGTRSQTAGPKQWEPRGNSETDGRTVEALLSLDDEGEREEVEQNKTERREIHLTEGVLVLHPNLFPYQNVLPLTSGTLGQ